jgi:hypothetical protein
MKLIVDLRISNNNPHTLWYGTEWLLAYAQKYKDTEVSYIGYERTFYDSALADFPRILVSSEKSFINRWKNKKILKDLA